VTRRTVGMLGERTFWPGGGGGRGGSVSWSHWNQKWVKGVFEYSGNLFLALDVTASVY